MFYQCDDNHKSIKIHSFNLKKVKFKSETICFLCVLSYIFLFVSVVHKVFFIWLLWFDLFSDSPNITPIWKRYDFLKIYRRNKKTNKQSKVRNKTKEKLLIYFNCSIHFLHFFLFLIRVLVKTFSLFFTTKNWGKCILNFSQLSFRIPTISFFCYLANLIWHCCWPKGCHKQFSLKCVVNMRSKNRCFFLMLLHRLHSLISSWFLITRELKENIPDSIPNTTPDILLKVETCEKLVEDVVLRVCVLCVYVYA